MRRAGARRLTTHLLGDRLFRCEARAYRRFRHGPGAFKVDFAIEGEVPWTAEAARRAGTVHLEGDSNEVFQSEMEVHSGRLPERSFVLVGQQFLADPMRSVGTINPVWSYAHDPIAYTGDATEAIVEQIERFAPGFRERVVGMAVRSTTEMAVLNPNFVGGDIIGGASSPGELLFRPRVALNRYSTGIPRCVSVFGVDAPRCRGPWDVRRQRCSPSACRARRAPQLMALARGRAGEPPCPHGSMGTYRLVFGPGPVPESDADSTAAGGVEAEMAFLGGATRSTSP